MTQVGLAEAVAPVLISQAALTRMAGKINFPTFELALPTGIKIHLAKSKSRHVLLPAAPVRYICADSNIAHRETAPPAMQTEPVPRRILTDGQIGKIHHQLGHCSQQQLVELQKFAKCKVDSSQIHRINQRCGRIRCVHRINPPVVSRWFDRPSGEILAIDIIYPFAEFGSGSNVPKSRLAYFASALLVVDSPTRFITCTRWWGGGLENETLTQIFLRGWVMHFGKPERIISDQ